MATVLREDDWKSIRLVMFTSDRVKISAATLLEFRIVLLRRFGTAAVPEADELLISLAAEIVPVDEEQVAVAIQAFTRFGKGRHPAALNFGDCFAYALAKALNEPLLFKGEDFRKTDVPVAAY